MPAPPTEPAGPEAEPATDEQPTGAALLGGLASREDVAKFFGISLSLLSWILFGHGKVGHYRVFEIKKKAGGSREIRAPRRSLREIQKKLSEVLVDAYEPRAAAHGYVSKRNVQTNAANHTGARYVLNVDLEDFFPSIHIGRVRGLFQGAPFECNFAVAKLLAQICCSEGRLPIGSPTSPIISNLICRRLDRELASLARRNGVWYTRYADDLTFSTKRSTFPHAFVHLDDKGDLVLGETLVRILEDNSFTANLKKTRLLTRFDRQLVTGVVVNQFTNLNRRYIRRVRAMLHAWDKYGLPGAQEYFEARFDSKDRYPGATPKFEDVLWGRISYISMVRGHDDRLARRFVNQFENLRNGVDINNAIDYEPPPHPGGNGARIGRREVLTVMFTDIVDSTAQAALLGDAKWHRLRDAHDRRVRRQIRRHGGRVIKTMGDGFLATLNSPSNAIQCAKAIASDVEAIGLDIRIGLHTAEIPLDGDDIEGIGVAIAARVSAMAGPGEILVSSTVKELVTGSDFHFYGRGTHELKGANTWVLYTVRRTKAPQLPPPPPPPDAK